MIDTLQKENLTCVLALTNDIVVVGADDLTLSVISLELKNSL